MLAILLGALLVISGVGFLGVAGNWPGPAMMALGAVLLLFWAAFL